MLKGEKMVNWFKEHYKKWKKSNKNINDIFGVLSLIVLGIGVGKGNVIIFYVLAALLALIWMILCSGITNVILYMIIGALFSYLVVDDRQLVKVIIPLALLLIGILCIYWANKLFNKGINEDDRKEEKKYILFLLGSLITIISALDLIHSLISLFQSWDKKGDPVTGVSLLVTIITFSIGQFFKIQGDKLSRKQKNQMALHKEINWRKELWDLEVKPEYSIQDLIKLNSFFNPKHKKKGKKEKEDIDVRLNLAVVNILSKYTCSNSVFFNKSENNKEEDEPLVTLFDYCLTEDVINIKLNPEENQEIRELIHELLKVDWNKQTKY